MARFVPDVVGCLERASGEMTFQRFISQQKASLIGLMASKGLVGPPSLSILLGAGVRRSTSFVLGVE